MKKLFSIILILGYFISYGQYDERQERLNISLNSDFVTVKSGKLSIGTEVELDMRYAYFKVGFENYALPINYFDIHGGIGANIKILPPFRTYVGLRGGVVWREDQATVGLFGFEAGIAYPLSESIEIGLYNTYDERQEGDFLGYPRFWQYSGKIRVVFYILKLKK